VPHLRSNERGNMFVVANVVIPSKLSSRQRDLFEELGHELGHDSDEHRGFFAKVKEAFGG